MPGRQLPLQLRVRLRLGGIRAQAVSEVAHPVKLGGTLDANVEVMAALSRRAEERLAAGDPAVAFMRVPQRRETVDSGGNVLLRRNDERKVDYRLGSQSWNGS